MSTYRKYSLEELEQLVRAKDETPVNMILDKTAVDFLLSLNINNRRLNDNVVAALLRSYQSIGWKCTESFCVTRDRRLGNGQHRSTMLKRAGYPENIRATVVFGADPESILVIDQHNKRSASASIKFAVGKNFTSSFLAAVRHDMTFIPSTMSFSSKIVQPSEMTDKIDEWELYEKEMPLLFHRQTIGTQSVALTAPMVLAIVHYRQRAGLEMANEFLHGFWGDRQCAADSPQRKALDYRITMLRKRGRDAESKVYRIFVRLLVAHFEGRKNPRLTEAVDWGVLRNRTPEGRRLS